MKGIGSRFGMNARNVLYTLQINIIIFYSVRVSNLLKIILEFFIIKYIKK